MKSYSLLFLLLISLRSLGQSYNDNIVIIDIGDESAEKVIKIISNVLKQDPKVIGLDVNLEYNELTDSSLFALLKSPNLVIGTKYTSVRFLSEFKNLTYGINEIELDEKNVYHGFKLAGYVGGSEQPHLTLQLVKLYNSSQYENIVSQYAEYGLTDLVLQYDFKDASPFFLTIRYEDLQSMNDNVCTNKIVLIGQSVDHPEMFKIKIAGKNAIKTGRGKNEVLYRTTINAIILDGLLNKD